MSAPPKLGTVLTIPQVAKLAGWSDDRMERHLKALNRELGGLLLRNVSRGTVRPRWTVTLEALQRVAPEWFEDAETLRSRVESLEAESKHQRAMLNMVVMRIEQLGRVG